MIETEIIEKGISFAICERNLVDKVSAAQIKGTDISAALEDIGIIIWIKRGAC